MKITQIRENGDTEALSVVNIDLLIEKMKRETKLRPVSELRQALHFVLPDEPCSLTSKLPRVIPAAAFVRKEGVMTLNEYNGVVMMEVNHLSGRTEADEIKELVKEFPQTFLAFTGSSGKSVKIWVRFTYPDDRLPVSREQVELFHAHAYQTAVKYYQPQLPFDIELKEPKIAYKETIRRKVKAEGKYKKQTGGHGQYGHVWIEFEPCVSDSLIFEEKVFGGAVPKNYFPAVEKGLQESVKKGVLAGCPVVGLKAILVDGSYHPVDSSEMAFKTAASLAYKEGLKQAEPVMLEPIGNLKAVVPDENTGDVMGELNKRRGRVLGMEPYEEGMTEISAEVPMREMHSFTMYLKQVTRGMGSFTFDFLRYEQLPANLVAEVITESIQE